MPADLFRTEREVRACQGVRVGHRVRIKRAVLEMFKANRMSERWLRTHSGVARVERIVVSTKWRWNSVYLKFEDNDRSAVLSAEDLEVVT